MFIIYGIITLGDAGNVHGFYAEDDTPNKFLVDNKIPKITYSPHYAKKYSKKDDAMKEVMDGALDFIPGSFYVFECDQ